MKKQDIRFLKWLKNRLGTLDNEAASHHYIKSEDAKIDKDVISQFATTLNTPENKDGNQIWEKLSSRMKNEKVIDLPKRKSNKYLLSIAASIIVLLGVMFGTTMTKTEVVCKKGQQKVYFLPDSSEVILNAQSQIRFNRFRYRWNRKVELDGEAFFKVKKGTTFEVAAKNTTTTVLGTSFNIYARNNELEVACKTGKVKVRIKNTDDNKILTPGHKVGLNKDGKLGDIEEVDNENIAKWQTGKFSYFDAPLPKVLQEVERQFDVKINCADCERRTYTGHFHNTSLNEALLMICIPMQMEYKVKNKTVQLNHK